METELVIYGQVQALTYQDIRQIESLNLQGTRRAVYFDGPIYGLVRADKKGGDLVTMPDGTVWLVALVLEIWPGWSKAAVTRQQNP
jgi:hypothetical protein